MESNLLAREFFRRARIKTRQRLYQNRVSLPFLSQDAFRSLADLVLSGESDLNSVDKSRLENTSVLYITSSYLQEFLNNRIESLNPKVIISGGSDTEFHAYPSRIPSKTRLLLLQNSFVSDGNLVRTLPIGLEDLRLGMNGLPRNLTVEIPWRNRRNEIMAGPFGETHGIRTDFLNTYSNTREGLRVLKKRIPPSEFNEYTNQFKYVLSLRGNGEDTHRNWESIYRGSYSVLLKSDWSESLNTLKLPIIQITNLSDFTVVLKELHPDPKSPREIETIWIDYWRNLVLDMI